jgi:hypothetical protein
MIYVLMGWLALCMLNGNGYCRWGILHFPGCGNLKLTGPMSSGTRQRFKLYHVECRAHVDTLFHSAQYWLSPRSCYLVTAFEV